MNEFVIIRMSHSQTLWNWLIRAHPKRLCDITPTIEHSFLCSWVDGRIYRNHFRGQWKPFFLDLSHLISCHQTVSFVIISFSRPISPFHSFFFHFCSTFFAFSCIFLLFSQHFSDFFIFSFSFPMLGPRTYCLFSINNSSLHKCFTIFSQSLRHLSSSLCCSAARGSRIHRCHREHHRASRTQHQIGVLG